MFDPAVSKSASDHTSQLTGWGLMIKAALTGRSQVELADHVGVHKNEIGKWLNAQTIPSPWAIERIATFTGVSVVEQMAALGWLSHGAIEAGNSAELFHPESVLEFRRIANDLVHLQRRVETVARVPFALARAVVDPPDSLGPSWKARWTAHVHSRVCGLLYPTPYGLHTEFKLTTHAARYDRDELREVIRVEPRLSSYLERNLGDFTNADPADPYATRIEVERLELATLMSVEPFARFGVWVGEGDSWRSMVAAESLHAPYAHIFVSEEEQRSIPAADHPINIRPSYSPIIIIGASHLAAPRLGQVLAASIGWAHINPAQDAIERLNDTAGLGWRNESVRNAIRGRFLARIESALHGGLRHTVLSLSQADICESDDVVAALNTLRGSLIVVLTPSDRALETYEALELDSAMTWAGKSISQWNRANFIRLAVDRVVSSLRSGPSHVITIPFAPEIAPGQGVDINSVHDGVADEIVEVAAAITRRLRIPPDDLSGLLGLYKRQIAGRATRVHIKTI